jgi:hypothetical protein
LKEQIRFKLVQLVWIKKDEGLFRPHLKANLESRVGSYKRLSKYLFFGDTRRVKKRKLAAEEKFQKKQKLAGEKVFISWGRKIETLERRFFFVN